LFARQGQVQLPPPARERGLRVLRRAGHGREPHRTPCPGREELGPSGKEHLRTPEVGPIAGDPEVPATRCVCVHAPTMRRGGDRWLSRTVLVVADEIEIRPLLASEHVAVGAATADAFREYWTPDKPGWEPYLARIADVGSRAEQATVLVAVDRGVIAGSVTLELESRIGPKPREPLAADEAHIRMLGVSPEHRGRGIARRLMLACIDIARRHGKLVMTLDTESDMVGARQLYKELGFDPTGTQQREGGPLLLGYALALDSKASTTR
jgi:ribosomal protein S18 acetylase RimI-like enzyme